MPVLVIRTLLILLALLFATPVGAMPACHDAPAAHAVPMEHHRAPDATPPHACPGCIPPGDWLAPHIAAPALAPPLPPLVRIRRLDLGQAAPPPLRPPRLG